MGDINIKLMQGIDAAENQLQKEKQPQKAEKPMKKEAETRYTKETAGKLQTTKEQSKSKKSTAMRKKGGNEQGKMSKKQVLSFRSMLADISIWKAYASTSVS